MTDLPQLQTLLVDAAVKRRRRRRVRRSAASALALAVLIAAIPWVLHDLRVPDREEPVTPSVVPTVEDAFGVFRRPASRADARGDAQPGDVVRSLGADAFLLLRADQLCLIAHNRYECGRAADYVSGTRALATVVDDTAFAVFPDGVRSVTRTWQGRTTRLQVSGNLLAAAVPPGRSRLDWRTPGGAAAHVWLRDFTSPRMWYPRLGVPEMERDRALGFPGARFLFAPPEGDVEAWLVPRRDAICLVARNAGEQRSVCRTPVNDTRKPLMLSLPSHPQRILVFAFASWQSPLSVSPERARRSISSDAIVVFDGDTARTVSYRDDRGRRVAVDIPAGSLMRPGDREVSPDAIP